MFRYYLKLGWHSIRRNPILSALMVAAISVGIGACMTVVNIDYVMSGNPIPHRSDVLFHVQVDNWDPNDPYTEPNEPPDQITYLDGTALLAARQARRQTLSFGTSRVIEPQGQDERPFQIGTRSTTADFFPMFDTPFIYGNGWDRAADDNEELVVVLSRATNERVFGGENSVGRTLIMNGDAYRVSGVIDTWEPMPKFYDVATGAFDESADAYFPFSVAIANQMDQDGNTSCWKPIQGEGAEGFLNSECVWMQLWVELHGESEKQEYMTFLNAYVESQKELGRFPRPLNNRLYDVMEWMDNQEVVEEDVRVMLGLSGLFLIVCLLNTVGLLLAKIMRRVGDISLRRALGASRSSVFIQYIVEAGMIGVGGGILGIAMTLLGLQGIRYLWGDADGVQHLFRLDWVMISASIAVAVLSALFAALYPTWRACAVQPASQLKAL